MTHIYRLVITKHSSGRLKAAADFTRWALERMIIDGPIESFFKNPSLEPSPEGDGILFHLRRDLVKLYGKEGENSGADPPHAMLAMMGILAGIDYLSKVYSHHQGYRDNRKRFVETVHDLCNITNDDSEAVYQFRCALVHSVALSTISTSRYKKNTRFIFEVTGDEPLFFIEKLSDVGNELRYRIGFWKLKEAFLDVIGRLEDIARDVGHPRNAHVVNMIGQMHSERILKA
jgi:hypothetical protein